MFERILISCRCWPRHQTIVLVAGPHLHVYRPLMVLIPRTSLPISYESFVTLSRALVSSANPNANAIWVAFYFAHCFRALFACACCNKFAAFSLCDSCTSFATKYLCRLVGIRGWWFWRASLRLGVARTNERRVGSTKRDGSTNWQWATRMDTGGGSAEQGTHLRG